MTDSINIYFYGPAPLKYSYEILGSDGAARKPDCLFMNTAPIYLDSYIKKTDAELYTKINWDHIQLRFLDQDSLIAELNKYNSNVLCVSLYIWNNEQTLGILSGLKAKIGRPLTIIAGGPSVGIVRNKNYLHENPDIDYAIFAQGEKPFSDILKSLTTGNPLKTIYTRNCAWIDKNTGKVKKADHEFYKDSKGSPYLDSQHILIDTVNKPEYAGYKFEFPWETSKGCPYNCSFCDWTSGLSNKVSKRKAIYEEELELFASLGIFRFYMGDANFGLHKEDEEITDTLVRLKVEKGYPFKFFSINFSKVKKDVVYRIADKMLKHDLLDYFKCSIQDMHEEILNNIDRPDIPWVEQIEYMKELVRNNPTSGFSVEVIQGLPGQTRETWENMLYEMSSYGFMMNIYKFMMIPNSPAGYDAEWNERMKIKTGQLYLDDTHSDEYVLGSYSFDLRDYAYFNLMTEFYMRMQRANFNDKSTFKRFNEFVKSHDSFEHILDGMEQYATHTPSSIMLASYYFNKLMFTFVKTNSNQADNAKLLDCIQRRPDIIEMLKSEKFKMLLNSTKKETA